VTSEPVIDVTQDWVLACDVQRSFMQDCFGISDFADCAGRCRQLRSLGGDCYSFIPLNDRRLAFYIGDASGKGLAAALMIANVQSSLRTAAFFADQDLAAVLTVVNHQSYTASASNRYATLFYGVFDAESHSLRYVNAGHNSPILLRSNGSVEHLEAGGPPIGLFADACYVENTILLNAGDVLLSYTDGVVEASDLSGGEWGVHRLLQTALDYTRRPGQDAETLVDFIFSSMDDFSGGQQDDDATVAVLRVL